MSQTAARLLSVVAAGLAVAALGACGGGGGGGGKGGDGAASSKEEQTFASRCASCHTLDAAGARGRFGPNLDELKPDAATVARQVRNGGSGMPSFKGQLSGSEIDALARWVARVSTG